MLSLKGLISYSELSLCVRITRYHGGHPIIMDRNWSECVEDFSENNSLYHGLYFIKTGVGSITIHHSLIPQIVEYYIEGESRTYSSATRVNL